MLHTVCDPGMKNVHECYNLQFEIGRIYFGSSACQWLISLRQQKHMYINYVVVTLISQMGSYSTSLG